MCKILGYLRLGYYGDCAAGLGGAMIKATIFRTGNPKPDIVQKVHVGIYSTYVGPRGVF